MTKNLRTVLLTGGSRGIGKAIKNKFLSENYIVEAPDRNDLDLSNLESVRNYCKSNKQRDFSVIINCAGINKINLLETLTDSELLETIQVNLIAPVLLLKTFTTKMKQNNYGRVVNIGSIWGEVSKPGRGAYSATKHGLHGITNTLALELATYNVLVNTVCPGFTLTQLTRQNNSPEQLLQISESIPMKRLAEPEEIAESVFFLASEKNTYITGQKIIIDGGYTIQ